MLAAIVAVAFAVCVALAFTPADVERLLADGPGRVRAFAAAARGDEAPRQDRVGFAYDAAAPYSVFSDMPLAEFLEVGRRIRAHVGERPVVISSAIGTRGHWYFFADLTPLGSDPEPSMTIVNSRLRARYLAGLEVGGIPCVVSTRPVDTELAIFRAQPGPRDEWWIETSDRPFYVACMRESALPIAQRSTP